MTLYRNSAAMVAMSAACGSIEPMRQRIQGHEGGS